MQDPTTDFDAIVAALVLRPLAAIADAYDANDLDGNARKFWGLIRELENSTPFDEIELYADAGGHCLLTLEHAMKARRALQTKTGILEALEPLAAIADAYDANRLGGEARKDTGPSLGCAQMVLISDIEIYQGRGGKRLLTLDDAHKARGVLKSAKSIH